jgi:uncharacterized UBP type Zn finger protein
MFGQVADRTYELNSVVEHVGSYLDSGHYLATSFIHRSKFWMEFNDAKAVAIIPNDALEAQAYLLVYSAYDEKNKKEYRKGLRFPVCCHEC